ncbi:hypothetical protein J3F83DRAFT_327062 [Trichoderma novae-zelandiae]
MVRWHFSDMGFRGLFHSTCPCNLLCRSALPLQHSLITHVGKPGSSQPRPAGYRRLCRRNHILVRPGPPNFEHTRGHPLLTLQIAGVHPKYEVQRDNVRHLLHLIYNNGFVIAGKDPVRPIPVLAVLRW